MPCPFGSKGLPPPVYVPPRSRAFPGDWICGLCGDLQFARNWKCRVCGGPRPRDGGSWSSGSNRCGDYYHHHHHHEHYGRSWGSGGRRSSGGNGCSSSEGLFSQRCLERTQSRSKRDDGPYSRRGIFERRTSNYMELSDDEEDSARGSRSANGKLKSRSREDEDDEFRRDYKLDFSPKSTLLLPDESYEQLRKDAKLRLEVNFPDINPRTSTTTDGIITTSTSTTAMPMPASRDVVMSGEHEGSCLNLGIHPAGILLDSALTTNKTISDISAAAVPKAIPAIIDSTCASECGAATTSASSPELLSSARSSPTATSSLCPLPSPRVNKIPPPTRSASKMPSPATSACSSTSVGGTRTSSTATTIYAGAQSSITGGTPVFPPHTSTIVQQHPHLLRGHQGATTSGGTIYYNGGGSYGTYPSRRGHHRHLTGPERRELAASRIRHHVHKPKPLDYNQFNPAKTSTSTSTTPNEMENDNENARPSNEGATTPKKKDDVGGSTSASSDTKTSTSMAELQVDLDTENKVVEPPGAADGQSRDTNRMSAGGAEQRVSASSSVMNASGDTPEVPAAKGARSETTEAAVSSSGEGAMETDVNLVPQAPLGVQRENTGATNALSSSLDAILTVHQRQLQQDQEQQELVSGQQQQEAVDRQREVAQRVENLQAAFTPTEDALPLNAISASSVVVPGTEANPIPFNATAACLNQNQIPTSSSLHEASATSNTSPSTAASDPSTTEEVRKQLSSCETPIADAAEVGDATLGKVVTSRAVRVRPAPY
ncbi:unnamed protein product [Amoebophrya sp. A25]|nr:unnamed protein product [Amoebophrya sp. A25]|eukprot:GSA25T00001491001.1